MNKIRVLYSVIFMMVSCHLYCGDFLKQFVKPEAQQKFFIGVIEEKQKLLEDLQKEQTEIVVLDKTLSEKLLRQIAEVKTALATVEVGIRKTPDNEVLVKQQSLLKESEQILKDTQRKQEDRTSQLTELVTQLSSFLEDPEFEGFKKKHKLQERVHYSFEDLQSLDEHILDYERRVAQLVEQEKNIRAERDSRRRSLALMQEENEKKHHDLQLMTELSKEDSVLTADSVREKEIFKFEEQLYKYKKQLEELKLKEIHYKTSLIEFQLFIAKANLELFKKQLRMIRSSIHVNEADVLMAEEDLAKEQRTYFTQKDHLRQQHDKIIRMQKAKEKELNDLSRILNISLGSDINEWSKKPKQTADSYVALAQVGALNTEIQLLLIEKDALDGQMAFEEEKFGYKKVLTDEKKTYLKISTRGFLTEEEIAKEHSEYEGKKKEVEEKLKLFQTKINAVANSLNQLKKTFDRLMALRDDAEKQKEVIFRQRLNEYVEFVQCLVRAERALRQQIDLLGKLTGIYSGIVSELNGTMRLIDFINVELQASTIWYRPAYAITLEGIKNVISDIQAFFADVRIYIEQFNAKVFFSHARNALSRWIDTLLLIIKMILCVIFFLFLKRYQEDISHFFFVHSRQYGNPTGIISFIVGTILLFMGNYYRSILLWIVMWLFVAMISDHYIYILFYLFSIPYLFYLSNGFMRFLMFMNAQYNYLFLPEDFQRRFELVFSTLLYMTIMIFFFRQAFMLSSVYLRSELPNILLAINFIILQIALIFLITKEQIMGIIPERSEFWRWIHFQVDHYYYLLLLFFIAIIVMSNPYVGFGRLVLYLLSGFVYMALLIKCLSVLHGFVKKLSSFLCFSQEDSVVRERFSYAKTCFGLIIIASFVILGFVGFIVSAKIWGWDIGWYDLKHWLGAPILLEGTTHPITTISLLKLILYVFGGFAVAYVLKEYVLARIFDLLLVESGVQHTVTSIIQYVVIIVAIFIGFQSVGLGSLIGNVFIALAFSIGLYIKEPISDFVSYFIILVQRPVKIGDYVQIDPDTMGVVRKITPRAVILRRKNSTTVVVPNSYVVSKSIENWNYVRNFIAVADIMLFVYFKEDPSRVKEILQQVVEEHAKVLKNPRSIVRLSNFTEYGYEFMVRVFISSAYTLEMWDIGSDIRLLIAKAFRENGIEFAIPMYKIDEFGDHYETKLGKEKVASDQRLKDISPKE
jgi:small-conductance mechanosensitive channel